MGHMPGPGDAQTWPHHVGRGDPRWSGADDEVRIANLSDRLYSERAATADWLLDAQCDLTPDECKAIVASMLERDDAETGRLLRIATHRVIRDGAKKDAQRAIETGVMP